jgi:hypothetical protein
MSTTQGDSFEFVSFIPPPSWVLQNVQHGRAYVRPNGVGVATLRASRSDSRPSSEAFTDVWRTQVQPVVAAPAPDPQLLRQGDFAIAVGGGQVRMRDKTVFVSLMTATGQGRTLDIVGMADDDEAVRELVAFFDTVTLMSGIPSATASSASDLVGRWWKDAGADRYYWLEFSAKVFYSYETPLQARETGTYGVQGDRLTMTPSTAVASTRGFSFECVGGTARLEFKNERSGLADGYWSNPSRSCKSN